jgi:hypothetical protein
MLGSKTAGVVSEPTAGSIARLYERSGLDSVIEIARCIAYDFVQCPRLYRSIPDQRAGADRDHAGMAQRGAALGSYCTYFGEVFAAAIGLRAATIAFVERAGKRRGTPIFREAAVIFRAHLGALDCKALEIADRNTAAAGAIDLKNTPLDPARMMVGGGGWGDHCSLDAICCSTVGGDPCTLIFAGSDYCCVTASGPTCTCRYLCPFLGPALFGTES